MMLEANENKQELQAATLAVEVVVNKSLLWMVHKCDSARSMGGRAWCVNATLPARELIQHKQVFLR